MGDCIPQLVTLTMPLQAQHVERERGTVGNPRQRDIISAWVLLPTVSSPRPGPAPA